MKFSYSGEARLSAEMKRKMKKTIKERYHGVNGYLR